MSYEVTERPRRDPVIQFSVFGENKVGRIHDLATRFSSQDIHIIAFSQLDSTECTVMRMIVDYPDFARKVLTEANYAFTETEILAVELKGESQFTKITGALVEAEINIHYLYPFIVRPHGHTALAISLEDNDLAREVLQVRQIRVIDQSDIAR